MIEAQKENIGAILQYLKSNVEDCIYMYIDIKQYGLGDSNMKVWFDMDSKGINLVVMKYHTSISVYTRFEEWDIEAVADIIQLEKPESITATGSIVKTLQEILANEYDATYGSVFQYTNYRMDHFDGIIEKADEQDAKEIAELIVQDEGIGGYYDVNDLAGQFIERMRMNMGRNYVIRNQEKIIAHIASYAECDDIATTGGLIVDPAYQTGVYGMVLENYIVEQLVKEGFKVYTFVISRMRKLLLTSMGNLCVGEYGKMVRKK